MLLAAGHTQRFKGGLRMTVYRRGGKILLNDSDLSQWIDNDEGLYNWWKGSHMGKTKFIKENRAELQGVIRAYLERKPGR